MALDGIYLSLLRKEFDPLIDGRVDKIHQPSREELIMTIRTKEGAQKLMFSTEAAILLGEEYPTASMRSSEIKSWLVRLSKQGAKIVVITSVNLADGGMSTVGYDKENNSFWKIKNDYVPAHYSGTGDMFTSVLIGGLLKGDSLPIAMNRATAFTELTVKTTYSYQTPWTDGLMLEGQLPWLTSYQELRDYTNL